MQDVIGGVIPLAAAIALGPIPIIAIALMLQTAAPGRTSVGFAIGWVIGIVALTIVLTGMASVVPEGDAAHPRHWIAVVQIGLGILLILLAIKKFRSRPTGEAEAEMPRFLGSLTSSTPAKSLLVGLVAAGINPKHIAFVAPIGTLIVGNGLSTAQVGLAIGIFTLLASVTVIGPTIAWRFAPKQVGRVVDAALTWMVRNMNVVSAVILLLIGTNIIGKGIANF